VAVVTQAHTERHFVAPGKLVLLGEYAVLDGCPAIAMAVDSGVKCVVAQDSGIQEVQIQCPDDRYVRPALIASNAPIGAYTFTSWNPPATETKAGLGTSAAATVVACLAARSLQGQPPTPQQLFTQARHVHHAVQGSGSGVDIAASCWGGIIRYDGASATVLPDLHPIVIWTGRSAQTGPRVERYMQ